MKRITVCMLAFTFLFLSVVLGGCGGPKEVTDKEITLSYGDGQTVNGIYTGTLEKGAPNGNGKFIVSGDDDWTYTGEFSEGRMGSNGQLDKFPVELELNGATCKGIYSGASVDGIPDGKGNFTFYQGDNEVSFEGTFSKKQITGLGNIKNFKITLKFQENDYEGIYNGEMTDGKLTGNGTFNYEKDDSYLKYDGQWGDGQIVGIGNLDTDSFIVHFPNSDREGPYKGELLDGIPSGQGEFSTINSEGNRYTYTGEWADGVWNGSGKQVFENPDFYIRVGNFKDGEFSPTVAQWFTAIGTGGGGAYTLTEKNENFLNTHEELFTSGSQDGVEEFINSDFTYQKYSKNPRSFDGSLIKVPNLTVFQISEYEGYYLGMDLATMILANDYNNNIYYIFMLGRAEDVYNGSTITACMLPLEYSTYEGTYGNKIWSIYGAGVYVSK